VLGWIATDGFPGSVKLQGSDRPSSVDSWTIDSPSATKAEYPTLAKTPSSVTLSDMPGSKPQSQPFPDGTLFEAHLQFIDNVYDLHKYPADTPTSAFTDPWNPAPLASFRWNVDGSYRVP
jgi:hypothetical protein